MIRLILLCFTILLFTNCTQQPKVDLKYLNGYWEIDRVVDSFGKNEKKYNFNPMVDYFKTTDSIGFRSKLKPNFTGNYQGSKQKLKYRISHKNGKYVITYNSISGSWNDILIEASDDQICIKNKQGIYYFYRKFTPIQL